MGHFDRTPAMSHDNEIAPGAAPAPAPWISTQHEMQTSARPVRSRIVKVKLTNGAWRLASVTYSYSSVESASDSRREHLYRVILQWLAEFDTRDGRSEKIPERVWTNRPVNTLQFRVLEMTGADGRRSAAARLGPKGQIAAEPPGIGVMTFLGAILVEWVADRHPDAVILHGSLYQIEVQSEESRALRDSFFTRAGFTVKPTSGGGGSFHAPSIRDLKITWNTEKVVELTPAAIADAVCAQLEAAVLRKKVATIEARIVAVMKEKRASEVLARIWLAISVVSLVFGLIFGIQPRIA
jgi:hypothetical protein